MAVRLDVWLDVACLFKTRSEAQKACRLGQVSVNGAPAKAHRDLKAGDELTISRPLGRRQLIEVIGVAEAGKEISTRPFQLVTGRNCRGTAFGGARGRTDTPKIVDWYMDGKIEIDPMITHRLTLDQINKGFDLMHAGESIRSVVIY